MKVEEATIAGIVADVSGRIGDPKYISGEVDRLMSAQPSVSQYVIAHQQELSVEGVVTVLFHAAVLYRSVVSAAGRAPATVSYPALDAAAKAVPDLEALAEEEPNLASYVLGNVDLDGGEPANKVAREVLAHVAKALVDG